MYCNKNISFKHSLLATTFHNSIIAVCCAALLTQRF